MHDSPNSDKPFGIHKSLRCGHCGDNTSADLRGYTDRRTRNSDNKHIGFLFLEA
jgi:hypothetical protein